MKNVVSIWKQPIYARLNSEGLKSLLLVMAMFPVLSQVLALLSEWSKGDGFHLQTFAVAFGFSLVVLLIIVFYIWFVMLIQNIGLQYSPANARLVPRIKTYMQIAIVTPVVVCAVLAVLLTWFITHKFSMLPGFICVVVTVFFMLIVRSQWAVIPMVISFQLPAMFKLSGIENIEQRIERTFGLPLNLLLLVAAILIVGLSVRWVFSVKDENLFRMHKRTVSFRRNMSGDKAHESGIMHALSGAFFSWMNFCVKQASQTNTNHRTRQSLIAFGLGPRLHWLTISTQFLAMLIWGLISVFVLTRFSAKPNDDFVSGFGIGFGAIVLISQPLLLGLQMFYSLYQTRMEQALVSLTPVVRDAQLQDSLLQQYLLRQFFILYGISLLVTALVCGFVFPFELKSAAMMLFVSAIFPMILVITRNHARMSSASDHPLIKLLFICIAIFAVFFCALLVLPLQLIWLYCLAIFTVTIVLLLRSIQLRRQSRMFPVGRGT